MDDFFDHAISTSSLEHDTTISPTGSGSRHERPGPRKNDSSDTTASCDSGVYSLCSSMPVSPTMNSPDLGQDNHIDGRIQFVWSMEGIQDSALPRTALSDQHHEKSCARCSLTEAEARKCRVDRRREQNRESQRKFRARKEAKIREAAGQVAVLENYVDFLEKHNNDLEALNSRLQQRIFDLENSRHVCTVETSNGAFVKKPELENWGSGAVAPAVPTSAEEPNAVHIPDLHLSLFDHELLPPYNSAMHNL